MTPLPLPRPRHHHRPRRGRGFMMFEMLAALTLIAVAALFANQVLLGIIRTMGQVERQRQAQRDIDNVLRLLRTDVWSADALQLEAGVLTIDDGRAIWSIEPGDEVARIAGRLRRESAEPGQDPVTSRFDLPATPNLALHEAGVKLHLDEQRVLIVSQQRLLEPGERVP